MCIRKKQHIGEKEEYLGSNVVNPQVKHIFNRTLTSLHCTSPHFTSQTINTLHDTPQFNPLHCPTLHFTSLHFISLHFTNHKYPSR
jgi:hypothetical protein